MSAALRLVVLAAAIAAGACATLRVGTDGLSFAEREARLKAVPAWEARGSIDVESAEETFEGLFTWIQDGEHLTLNVRHRSRINVLLVEGTADALVITPRGGERHELATPEADLSALLEDASGGAPTLPVTSFRSWLLGLPDDAHRADVDRRADGTLERLAQRLWDVRYPAYQLAASPAGDMLVPREIELEHGDWSLRVTVREWAPLEPDAAP
jgi:outer membrane biogenesis lipoprotein LolB